MFKKKATWFSVFFETFFLVQWMDAHFRNTKNPINIYWIHFEKLETIFRLSFKCNYIYCIKLTCYHVIVNKEESGRNRIINTSIIKAWRYGHASINKSCLESNLRSFLPFHFIHWLSNRVGSLSSNLQLNISAFLLWGFQHIQSSVCSGM